MTPFFAELEHRHAARATRYALEVSEMERTGQVVEATAEGVLRPPPMPSLDRLSAMRVKVDEAATKAIADEKSTDAKVASDAKAVIAQTELDKAYIASLERWAKGEPTPEEIEAEAEKAMSLAAEKKAWLNKHEAKSIQEKMAVGR